MSGKNGSPLPVLLLAFAVASGCKFANTKSTGSKTAGMNGTHAREGVFAAAGPSVHAGGNAGVREIVDVMPTLLALAVSPIPAGLDGTAMTSVLATAPSYGEARTVESPSVRVELDAASEADRAARLAALGYLEPRG